MIHICNDLKKHAGEVLAAIRNFKFEKTPEGIYFPQMRALASGLYTHDVNGQDVRMDANLLTDQGLTYLLATGVGNESKITAWYLALFGGAVNPAAGWTGANFAANASEITSTTEGYGETTRPIFTPGVAASNAIDNVGDKAAFTIVSAATLSVAGAGLLSNNVRGSTSGKLLSATRFASARTLTNGDVFNLGYRAQLAAA